jgi:hypothetical protein
MFFSDFVVRQPHFTKPSGKQIEIADLLVPFGDTLLVFQVKSKLELKPASEKSSVDFGRITKAVEEGIAQLRVVNRAIANDWLRIVRTVRGLDVEIDSSAISNLAGVVVVDLIGEESLPPEERTSLFSSFTRRHNIPIHVFLGVDFLEIARELDTLPDFMEFLATTQSLYEDGHLLMPPSVLDLLAFYKMDPDRLNSVLNSDTNLIIEEGLWESYRKDHAAEIAARDELNEPSYLIDQVIETLHTAVGYDMEGNVLADLGLRGQGTVEGYMTVARELASLSRLERRILGERLLKCLRKSMETGRSFSLLVLDDRKTGYLVLAKSGDRMERREFLYTITAIAYCHLGLNRIISVATELLAGEGRSYDVIGLRDVRFENADELAAAANDFFGETYRSRGTEFGPPANSDA